HLALAEFDAAVVGRAGDIHRDHDREFALLAEFPDVRLVHPGGDVPIDETHLVAVLVLPEIVEIETLAAERRKVFAGKRLADQAPRLELELAHPAHHLLDLFVRKHAPEDQGTGTLWRIR